MPLPWLIGAAVVGLGAAIVAAVNSDDTPSSSADNSTEERRRREAAAERQRKDERKKKLESARVLFEERGTEIGQQLANTLDGWVDVADEPVFAAKLLASGYAKRSADEVVPHEVGNVLAETFSAKDKELGVVMRDLDFFNEVYDVQLRGTTRLYTTLTEIQAVEKDLSDLAKLRKQLERIRATRLEATSDLTEVAT
ncbi:hypothetical protein [Massilia sp.]|uniref:hypothetical protein n=1 Tax=Massilia sp. TaxID=1882437 RepID=UPI0028A05324|nr:hypothetical protein [Massilia sp.]